MDRRGEKGNMVRFADSAQSFTKYADAAQKDILKKLDKDLKAGKLDHVKDLPKYWTKYTSVELEYILNYKEDLSAGQTSQIK